MTICATQLTCRSGRSEGHNLSGASCCFGCKDEFRWHRHLRHDRKVWLIWLGFLAFVNYLVMIMVPSHVDGHLVCSGCEVLPDFSKEPTKMSLTVPFGSVDHILSRGILWIVAIVAVDADVKQQRYGRHVTRFCVYGRVTLELLAIFSPPSIGLDLPLVHSKFKDELLFFLDCLLRRHSKILAHHTLTLHQVVE